MTQSPQPSGSSTDHPAAEPTGGVADGADPVVHEAVDPVILDALIEQIGGADIDMRGQLIDTYLSDAERRITDLVLAVSVSDADAVATAAHGLRSGSALFGAMTLAELLQRSETMARTGSGDLRSIGEQIEVEYRNVAVALERLRLSA